MICTSNARSTSPRKYRAQSGSAYVLGSRRRARIPPPTARVPQPKRRRRCSHPSLQRAYQTVEERPPIGAAEQRVRSIFGMRHQPQDRAAVAEDAGDRTRRTVEIYRSGKLPIPPAIAEGDEPLMLEPVERLGVGSVIPVVVSNRHPDRLPCCVAASKDRLIVLD